MQTSEIIDQLILFSLDFKPNCSQDSNFTKISTFPPQSNGSICMWNFDSEPSESQFDVLSFNDCLVFCLPILEDYFLSSGYQVITTKYPRVALAVIAKLFEKVDSKMAEIENPISPNAKIGRNVSIGRGCVIIGNVTIGDNCHLGANTVLHDGSILHNNIEIGDNSTIGSSGFGYVKLPDNKLMRVPHLGGVIIEDDVHIGSNTCIDRGTIDNTVIGAGSKIDNLVHIAHNVQIGRNVFIIAGAEISGSVKIGDNAWIAPNVSIKEKVTIGEGSVVGLGSVVLKDVAPNLVVAGVPAKEIIKSTTNQI